MRRGRAGAMHRLVGQPIYTRLNQPLNHRASTPYKLHLHYKTVIDEDSQSVNASPRSRLEDRIRTLRPMFLLT